MIASNPRPTSRRKQQMTEPDCKSLSEVLTELESVAPGVPLLALGQTVFWDEPMKAGVALAIKKLGHKRTLVAGVHDTDYFAKLPHGEHHPGKYKAFPHNDTTTKGLWSAAGEFSALFGSETVVSKEILAKAGTRLEKLQKARPGFLDQVTEAWGWRGIVSLDDHPPITADLPARELFPQIQATFDWAVNTSLDSLAGEGRAKAEELFEELRSQMCQLADEPGLSVATFYKRLLPIMYEFCANAHVQIDTTTTSELLRFNTSTCHLPRFELVNLFVSHPTRPTATKAYDTAIHGASGLYELSRFGTGAIPFDLVIPGKGRGTVRLGNFGAVINTPNPQFLTFKKPLNSIQEFAALVEAKFGPDCVLVGKAVSLIGMLSREYAFVFHEGASSYVKSSRKMHQILAQQGHPLALNPILRIRYDAWEAMSVCCSWLKLPEPFPRAFGTEELCAPSFSRRWKQVAKEQRATIHKLSTLRRPIELIRYLDGALGGSWNCLAAEYEDLHGRLNHLREGLDQLSVEKQACYAKLQELKLERVRVEKARGDHFRAFIFEKAPTEEALKERENHGAELAQVLHAINDAKTKLRRVRHAQYQLAVDPEILSIHERGRSIELEAELKRARIVRAAVIASTGLEHAAQRPSAWWFRMVCPDGLWFRETIDSAKSYLEPLV